MPRRFLFESRSVTQAHTAFPMLYLNMREENKTLKKVPTRRPLPISGIGGFQAPPVWVCDSCLSGATPHVSLVPWDMRSLSFHIHPPLSRSSGHSHARHSSAGRQWAQPGGWLSTSFFSGIDTFSCKPVCSTIASVCENPMSLSGELS